MSSNTKLPALPPPPAIRDGITWRDDERKAIDEYARAAILADRERQAGEAVARLLYWHGPSHMTAPSGGVCARTFTEFPREEADKPGSYWKNGPSLFASLPAPQAVQAEPVAWWRVSYVDEEGFSDADVQIGANVPTILPDNGFPWQPLYGSPIPVRPAAPSPDGKAEQAEAPNQCDGCAIGAPINGWGNHKYPDGSRIACTKDRYATQPTASNASNHRPSQEWYRNKIAETLDDDFTIGPAPTASNAGERLSDEDCPVDLDKTGKVLTNAAGLAQRFADLYTQIEELTRDRDEWKQQHENLLFVRQQDLAALATKPPAGEQKPTAQQITDYLRGLDGMVSVKAEDANNYCRVLTALGMEEEGDPVAAIEDLKAAVHDAEEAALQPEQVAQDGGKKLWLWQNFVDGRPEYWAFDNPFPVHLDCGDPQTLGEPVGYALLKPSRPGRTDVSEEQVLQRIRAAK